MLLLALIKSVLIVVALTGLVLAPHLSLTGLAPPRAGTSSHEDSVGLRPPLSAAQAVLLLAFSSLALLLAVASARSLTRRHYVSGP